VTEDRSSPDVGGVLIRLAATVRDSLVPLATDRGLSGELFTLASVLRLLGGAAGDLAGQAAEDAEDAAATLVAAGSGRGVAGGRDPRASLASLVAEGGARTEPALAVVSAYCARTLNRGLVPLLSPGGRGGAGAAPAAPVAPRSLTDPQASAPLTDLLASALGRSVTIRSLEPTAEGFAAETVVCRLADGDPAAVVVRAQWPELLLSGVPGSVLTQARAARAAASAGLPVAAVVAAEPASAVGAPLLVTRYVEGIVPTGWTPHGRAFLDRLRQDGAPRFLDDLVRVHSVDWRSEGFGEIAAGPGVAERLADRVAGMVRLYRRAQVAPDPLLELALERLADGGGQWGDEVLIHGDYRPGNIIYSPAGEVRAVIDWDASKVTDVHEELAQLLLWAYRDRQGRAVGLLGDEELLAGYAERTGRRVDPAGLQYYRLLTTVQHYLVFALLARSWWDSGGSVRAARALFTLPDCRAQVAALLEVS